MTTTISPEPQDRTLRAATHDTVATPLPAPGPFAPAEQGKSTDMGGALGLALLVMYPVCAVIFVIIAGVVLGGPSFPT